MSMLLVALRLCLAFFGLGNPGLFHCEDSCLVSGSYPQTQLSSPVMTLDMQDGSSTARWRSYWQIATRSSFSSRVRSQGTNSAATRCMFKSHLRIVSTLPYDTLMIVTMPLKVLRRSLYTSRRIISTFLGVELVEVRPDLSSSSIDVLPFLKRVCHSKHLALLMASFLHARRSISNSPLQVCRVSCRIWCLLSAPVSRPCWNRKRKETRCDKHSYCATPNVHTATPLGMLSGDIPCSQAQRTHSRTAIGWRSMELV